MTPCSGLLCGTSGEFLGRRPLPRLLRERPFVVLLGPQGVGKTSVALRLAGPDVLHLARGEVREACVRAVRRQAWPQDVLEVPALVLDGPSFLHRRPGATRLLHQLIAERTAAGRRTLACQGADESVSLLLDAVEPEYRVTVCLRFPRGRGRIRFAVRMAERMGLERRVGRTLHVEEPWTYARVIEALSERGGRPPPAGW